MSYLKSVKLSSFDIQSRTHKDVTYEVTDNQIKIVNNTNSYTSENFNLVKNLDASPYIRIGWLPYLNRRVKKITFKIKWSKHTLNGVTDTEILLGLPSGFDHALCYNRQPAQVQTDSIKRLKFSGKITEQSESTTSISIPYEKSDSNYFYSSYERVFNEPCFIGSANEYGSSIFSLLEVYLSLHGYAEVYIYDVSLELEDNTYANYFTNEEYKKSIIFYCKSIPSDISSMPGKAWLACNAKYYTGNAWYDIEM